MVLGDNGHGHLRDDPLYHPMESGLAILPLPHLLRPERGSVFLRPWAIYPAIYDLARDMARHDCGLDKLAFPWYDTDGICDYCRNVDIRLRPCLGQVGCVFRMGAMDH